jgi:pimeloyl-ACP methyl ester carboxylesterase
MKESAVLFGKYNNLVGIITDPPPTNIPPSPVAVLLLNSGFIHRVGPGRLYTKLARSLAKAGLTVLRFDFSGVGDSEPTKDQSRYEVSTVHEAQEAMDLLSSTRGINKFILMGICSGANHSLRIASSDPRVVGAVPIESYTYITASYYIHYYLRHSLNLRTWLNLFKGNIKLFRSFRFLIEILKKAAEPLPAESDPTWLLPPVEKIVSNIRALVERGVFLCFIYAKGSAAYYNYRTHVMKVSRELRSQKRIQLIEFEEADHTFTPLSQQDSIIKAICEWTQGTMVLKGSVADRDGAKVSV